jgi:hypothetical protein
MALPVKILIVGAAAAERFLRRQRGGLLVLLLKNPVVLVRDMIPRDG